MDMEHTDVLADILRHLPPRALAASRCVCRAWRATVDHHRLLRAELLPLSLDGVIYNIDKTDAPKLFARRRSTARYITSRLDYLDDRPGYAEVTGEITDYSNGLFLILNKQVVNPATRQWASLPRLTCSCSWRVETCGRCYSNSYLVYDPAVSPHYEVLFVPRVPRYVPADVARSTEWPPAVFAMHVFSSETNCWRKRSFAREGDAAGTMADMNSHWKSDGELYYSAHWKGSLYVPLRHSNGDFVLRIKLWDDKYQVIKLPEGGKGSLFRLGKSKKGVYCVLDIDGRITFQIWILSESHEGVIDWVLNNEICFETAWRIYPCRRLDNGPWISQSLDQEESLLENNVNPEVAYEYNQAVSKDGFEWDSDDENAVTTVDWPKKGSPGAPAHLFWCLGFHPYKEIALFHDDHRSATFAYYLNSSKVRYLGIMEHEFSEIDISFAYTPCWTMDLPGSN